MKLFRTKKSKEQQFWDWFIKSEEMLFQLLSPDHKLWHELSKRLRAVDSNLTFEVGTQPEANGRRQLAISADGIRDSFASVEALADTAPSLQRWNIVRFRPPVQDYADNELQMHDEKVAGSDIDCVLAPNETGTINVCLRIPGCPEVNDRKYAHIGFILLDMALGEYDVECSVGEFVVVPDNFELDEARLIPFADLRDEFCRLRTQESDRH